MRRILGLTLAVALLGAAILLLGMMFLQWLDTVTSLRFPISAANDTYLEVKYNNGFSLGNDRRELLDVWYIEQGLFFKKRRQLVFIGKSSTTCPLYSAKVVAAYDAQQHLTLTLAGRPFYVFRPAVLARPVEYGYLSACQDYMIPGATGYH